MTDGVTSTAQLDAALEPGHRVGEYVIEEQVGRGGFGSVYSAVHPLIGKRVAIKVLGWRFTADDHVVARFAAEARAVNQIGHRNIIDIFGFSRLPDGRHYYVMELLDGTSLAAHLDVRAALPLEEAVPILRAIARALDAAHAKGIAHRDLKPENVFLARDPDGGVFPKLLDFGIAKLLGADRGHGHRTETGVPLGTPAYMSPEQCRGREIDHRTDIYSLGVVAYEVLTGRLPFDGEYMDLMLHHMNDEPPPPSTWNPRLTPAIDTGIAWMMHKDPACRPATAFAGIDVLTPGRPATPVPWSTADARRTGAEARGRTELAASLTPSMRTRFRVGRRNRIALAMASAVVVASVLAIWRGGGESERVASTPPVHLDASVVHVSPADAPRDTSPVAETVRIALEVTPASADVLLDEVPIARSFEVEASERPRRLVVRAPGYRERVLDLVARRHETIVIDLAPLARAERKRGKKREHSPAPGAEPATGLIGGKDL